jgi:hypothetical protein
MCPPASMAQGTGDKLVTNVASVPRGTGDRRYSRNATVGMTPTLTVSILLVVVSYGIMGLPYLGFESDYLSLSASDKLCPQVVAQPNRYKLNRFLILEAKIAAVIGRDFGQ